MFSFGWGQRKRFARAAMAKPAAKRAKTVAAKVTRLQRQVALLKPETKYQISGISVSNIAAATGYINYVSDIVQGTTDNTRIGDSIRPQWIQLRGVSSTVGAIGFRVMIVKDADSNGAIPDIEGSTSSIFLDAVARTTCQLTATRKRFSVLFDKYYTTNSLTYGANNAGYFDSGPIKLSGISTYRATGGTVADGGKNQYYVVVLVDDADTLDLNARVVFAYTDV